MKKKITTAVISSVLIAPTLWMIYLLLVGWLDFNGVLKIILSPWMIMAMTFAIFSANFVLTRIFNSIENSVENKNYEKAQKAIFLIPILHLVSAFVYALYATPIALLKLDISLHDFIVVSCFGPCMIVLITMPFSIILLRQIEIWAGDNQIPIKGKYYLSIKGRLMATVIKSTIGMAATLAISMYLLIGQSIVDGVLVVTIQFIVYKIIILVILAIVQIILPFYILGDQISGVIKHIRDFASHISNGNLTKTFTIHQRDEIGMLSADLLNMNEQLFSIVSQIKNSSLSIEKTSGNIHTISENYSKGFKKQVSFSEEVAASMEEMAANIKQSTSNSEGGSKIANQTYEETKKGTVILEELITAIQLISQKITVIEEIEKKTKMLSLNASIEAAKAGNYGRSFAVIAAEVRKLAEDSGVAADEIKQLSKDTLALSATSEQILLKILPSIKTTTELVLEITESNQEQNIGANQINNAIQQLNKITHSNEADSENLVESANGLDHLAVSLKKIIDFFKINDLNLNK